MTSPYQCPVTSPLIFDPNMITFPAYWCPPMCEHGLTEILLWRLRNSISSLNLPTRAGPQTPQRRSRDPWEHTKTYEPFNLSGVPGSHSPSFTSTSSTNVSTSKCVNLLHFSPKSISNKFRGEKNHLTKSQMGMPLTCILSCLERLVHPHLMSRFHHVPHILSSGSKEKWEERDKGRRLTSTDIILGEGEVTE